MHYLLLIFIVENIKLPVSEPAIKLVPIINEIGILTDSRLRKFIFLFSLLFCIPKSKKINNARFTVKVEIL